MEKRECTTPNGGKYIVTWYTEEELQAIDDWLLANAWKPHHFLSASKSDCMAESTFKNNSPDLQPT